MAERETLTIRRGDFPEVYRLLKLQQDGSIDGTCAIRSQRQCPYGSKIPHCSSCRFATTTEAYLHNWLKEKFPEEKIVLREVKIGNDERDSYVRYRLFQISGKRSLKWVQLGYLQPLGDNGSTADLSALVVETDKNFLTSYEHQKWFAKFVRSTGSK